METISKVLIANRGEVVCRIARTVRDMGKKSVAVFTESDAGAVFIDSADEVLFIKGEDSYSGYLDQDVLIEAAKASDADAIHPGFGFLSENPDFARNVRRHGIKFIGPHEDAIRDMGDKLRAKALAIKAGVNVIPGTASPVTNIAQAMRAVSKIGGYPVMIKAAAGGGGKGMRIVHAQSEFEEAFELTVSEAEKSFKNGSVFIEKYIANPRHIEIQVIADKYGNIVCLGERECSIQRRHQKIIEETPSVLLDHAMRETMYEQCISLSRSIGYYSVGTVEFVATRDREFFFLEMNTRLQVEHTVTEMVTGLDLVELMIRIEEGYPLDFTQHDVKFKGHAMECRIYAEDTDNDFAPSIGCVTHYLEPKDQQNLRIESGVNEGSEVSSHYDPMIVKLCSYGDNRSECIKNMSSALSQFVIGGKELVTNMAFLERIVRHPNFISGDISTAFVENECPPVSQVPSLELNIMIAALVCRFASEESVQLSPERRELIVKVQDKYINVDLLINNDQYLVTIGSDTMQFNITASNFVIMQLKFVDGSQSYVKVNDPSYESGDLSYKASFAGMTIQCRIFEASVGELFKYMPPPKLASDDPNNVVAQMSGMVVKVFVVAGNRVKKGDRLLCIEAMKMQNILYAKVNAVVESVNAKNGDLVSKGEVLVRLSTR